MIESQQGKGIATAAVRSIVGCAESMGAPAGVSHGSDASKRVFEQWDVEEAEVLESCTRYRKDLSWR